MAFPLSIFKSPQNNDLEIIGNESYPSSPSKVSNPSSPSTARAILHTTRELDIIKLINENPLKNSFSLKKIIGDDIAFFKSSKCKNTATTAIEINPTISNLNAESEFPRIMTMETVRKNNQDEKKDTADFKIMKKSDKAFNPPSMVIEFMIKEKQKSVLKLKILLVKFLLPHIIACLVSIGFIFSQIKIDSICWSSDQCNCQNSFLIKIYTIIRSILTYWNFVLLMSYYAMFSIKEISDNKPLKISFVFLFYFFIFAIYLTNDGNSSDLMMYGSALIGMLFIYFIVLYKLKFNWFMMSMEQTYFNYFYHYIHFFQKVSSNC